MMHELQFRGIASHSGQVVRPARQGQERPGSEHAIGPIPAGMAALGNQAAQRMLYSRAIQAKLVVNEPGDEYEREADRMAEQVMSMPEPAAPRQVQRSCPECEDEVQRQPEKEEEEEKVQTKPIAEQITPLVQRQETPEEEEEPVQAKLNDGRVQRQEEPEEEEETVETKRADGKAPQVSPGLEAQIRSLKGGGQPLPESVRRFFEPRFGFDFSQVRVHTDAYASQVTKALNARAFTMGQDVVLGERLHLPGMKEKQKLLAHELTHVMQQRSNYGSSTRPGPLHDHLSFSPYPTKMSRVRRKWGGFLIDPYETNEPFVEKVRSDLNQLNATNQGNKLLSIIKANRCSFGKYLIRIIPQNFCSFDPGPWGSYPRINYATKGCLTENRCRIGDPRWVNAPNYVNLFHEIVHAYLNLVANEEHTNECKVIGLGNYFNSIPYNENRLRCEIEKKAPVRPCYDHTCKDYPPPTCPPKPLFEKKTLWPKFIEGSSVTLQEEAEKGEVIMMKRGVEPILIRPRQESKIISPRDEWHPLSQSERTFFELSIGADISDVRVQNDPQAAEGTRALNSHAFAFALDMVGAGQYSSVAHQEQLSRTNSLNHLNIMRKQKSKPKKSITLEQYNRLDFYPHNPVKIDEVLLGQFAKAREAAGKTRAISIEDLDDIFMVLEIIAEKSKGRVTPFISELHILGHGEPGEFKFGNYKYNVKDFEKIKAGKAQKYLKSGATIYLEGCDAAAGPRGRQFFYQIGRVFFGSKTGHIWGNTCRVFGAVIDITTCKPIKYKYPDMKIIK